MSDVLDITPDVHFLNSIRADRGSWSTLIAEAVDNSLDATATDIAIQLQTNGVVIADDGCGISRAHQSAIVRLGEHRPHPGTKLGRFGMGIKYNATSAGDLLEVDSLSPDGHMLLVVDWSKVIQRGRWEIPTPRWHPMIVRGTGTTITISRLRWERPKDRDIAAVREQLAQMFYPAIEHGATIRVNNIAIPLLHEPDLSEVIEQSVQLPNGKGAQVRGGILVRPETPSTLYGVQVSYKHRVILSKSNFGCGSYSGTRRMFARVVLTADWGLSRFKDGLVDDDAEQLESSVEEILRPILEQCHSAQMELKVEEMTERLNELLPPDIRAARPPRKQVKHQRGRKREPRQGESDKDESLTGPARMPKTPINRLMVTFEGPLCREHGYGMFTKGRPNRITLATDNPDIAALLEQRDTRLAARCLLGYALMIYHHAKETDPQQSLPFDAELSFGLRVWNSALRQDASEPSMAAGE